MASTLLAMPACGSIGSGDAQGLYVGSYSGGYTFQTPRPFYQDVQGTNNDQVTIVPGRSHDYAVDLGRLVPNCRMDADASGGELVAPSGQGCTIPPDATGATTRLTLTSGRGSVYSASLSMTWDGSFFATGATGGSGTFHFTYNGRKQ